MAGRKMDVPLHQEAEQLSLRDVFVDSHEAEYRERSKKKQHKSIVGSKQYKMMRAE